MWVKIKSKNSYQSARVRRKMIAVGAQHVIIIARDQTVINFEYGHTGTNAERQLQGARHRNVLDRIVKESKSQITNKNYPPISPEDMELQHCGLWVVVERGLNKMHGNNCTKCRAAVAPEEVKAQAQRQVSQTATAINDYNSTVPVLTKTGPTIETGVDFQFASPSATAISTVLSTTPPNLTVPNTREALPTGYTRSKLVEEVDSLESKLTEFFVDMQTRSERLAKLIDPIREWASAISEAEVEIQALEQEQAMLNRKRQELMRRLNA